MADFSRQATEAKKQLKNHFKEQKRGGGEPSQM